MHSRMRRGCDSQWEVSVGEQAQAVNNWEEETAFWCFLHTVNTGTWTWTPEGFAISLMVTWGGLCYFRGSK